MPNGIIIPNLMEIIKYGEEINKLKGKVENNATRISELESKTEDIKGKQNTIISNVNSITGVDILKDKSLGLPLSFRIGGAGGISITGVSIPSPPTMTIKIADREDLKDWLNGMVNVVRNAYNGLYGMAGSLSALNSKINDLNGKIDSINSAFTLRIFKGVPLTLAGKSYPNKISYNSLVDFINALQVADITKNPFTALHGMFSDMTQALGNYVNSKISAFENKIAPLDTLYKQFSISNPSKPETIRDVIFNQKNIMSNYTFGGETYSINGIISNINSAMYKISSNLRNIGNLFLQPAETPSSCTGGNIWQALVDLYAYNSHITTHRGKGYIRQMKGVISNIQSQFSSLSSAIGTPSNLKNAFKGAEFNAHIDGSGAKLTFHIECALLRDANKTYHFKYDKLTDAIDSLITLATSHMNNYEGDPLDDIHCAMVHLWQIPQLLISAFGYPFKTSVVKIINHSKTKHYMANASGTKIAGFVVNPIYLTFNNIRNYAAEIAGKFGDISTQLGNIAQTLYCINSHLVKIGKKMGTGGTIDNNINAIMNNLSVLTNMLSSMRNNIAALDNIMAEIQGVLPS